MFNEEIHVYPFGLKGEAYGKILPGPTELPDPLAVLVVLLCFAPSTVYMHGSQRAEAFRKLRLAMSLIEGRPIGFEMPDIQMDYDAVAAPVGLHGILTARQKAWMVDDLYVQVSFTYPDRTVETGIGDALATSMTLFDILALRHGSLHSVDHEPLELSADVVRSLRMAMGQHYQAGSVVINRDLLDYRNKVAVMCRAALANEDPIIAYQSFLAASKPYFLDFAPRHGVGKYETFVTVEGGPEHSIWAAKS